MWRLSSLMLLSGSPKTTQYPRPCLGTVGTLLSTELSRLFNPQNSRKLSDGAKDITPPAELRVQREEQAFSIKLKGFRFCGLPSLGFPSSSSPTLLSPR